MNRYHLKILHSPADTAGAKQEGQAMDRAQRAVELHNTGANCAQAVACVFSDLTGLSEEMAMKVCGTFGGGFRCGEICGALSGAGVVLGMLYPHTDIRDMQAKSFVSKKMMEFERRFLARFPALRCADIRDLPPDLEASPAAKRMGAVRSCSVYIAAAVEILEEMTSESQE